MILSSTPDNIAKAVALLQQGQLVALPTETVYGLGADASNPEAVKRIFEAKGRPADHPLIVHLADADKMKAWAESIPEAAWKLAHAFWPGPMTLILKKQAHVCHVVTGGQQTVGLRVPNHAVAQALLHAFKGGIAAPSANRFGCISPTSAQHVLEEMQERIPLILDGGLCEVGIESTIIDLSRGAAVILRPGMIGAAAIAAVLGQDSESQNSPTEQAPRVSGSLMAHYAPRTPMQYLNTDSMKNVAADCAVLSFSHERTPTHRAMWIRAPSDAIRYAHDLYANLRALDASAAPLINVEVLPGLCEWDAVRDRLGRAMVGSGAKQATIFSNLQEK